MYSNIQNKPPHLRISLFAELLLLLFGQEPHGHAEQVVVVRPAALVLLLFLLLLLFSLHFFFILRNDKSES